MRRRAVAFFGLVILVILLGVLVNSCESSAYSSSLKNYADNVDAIIQQSNTTGRQFFAVLTGGGGARSVYTSLNQARNTAAGELSHARQLSAPSNLGTAQQDLVLALQLRHDAMAGVAANIEQALGGQTSADAVSAIASQMARLYASDVLYKSYVLPLVIGALKQNGIAVGGLNGQPIEQGQIFPDLRWLTPAFVASQLHVRGAAAASQAVAPGTHGHALNSVSVSGTTLQTGATNTLPASPTFTLNFANTGQNSETNVVCRVTLSPTGSGTRASGQTVVPQTTAGEQTSCTVSLAKAPAAGSYTATATIVPVPGEKNSANNTLTFPVTIQ